MSVEDAETGDIYADANGKLWRITAVYREPTVEAEEVEGTLNDPNAPKPYLGAAMGAMGQMPPLRATIDKRIQRGFTGATTWFGWQRIFRRVQAAPTAPTEQAS